MTSSSIDQANYQQQQPPQQVVVTATGAAAAGVAGLTQPPGGVGAVWMQYPAAAMVMQHQMMAAPGPGHYPPPPHYIPAYHHPQHPYVQHPPPPSPHRHPPHHHRNNHHANGNGFNGNNNNNNNSGNNNNNNNNNNNGINEGENKTIWVGDLHHWMDEIYLSSCFGSVGEITSVKVIRNKQTGASEGYGFVEFLTRATAEKVLQNFVGNGIMMPNAEQPFRLNWATFSMGDKRTDNASDLSIFVGDLAADVTDTMLHELFSTKYPSVKAAKVVIDANSGRSKGYGFVRFGDDSERTQAMTDMNGIYCSTRPMRIGPATPRKSLGYQQGGHGSNGNSVHSSQSDGDSSNTTIFVGGLDPSVTDEELKLPFSQHGDIVSVKIPVGKGCGFVQFANRPNAEEALGKLNGTVIGKQTVRLSWGRNLGNKQSRGDYPNQWNGGYYGSPMYEGFGYVPHPHDPSMYSPYGGYPTYGNQQQVS